MLEILFFARLREQLGVGRLQVPYSDAVATLAGLQDHLIAEHGELWAQALQAENVLRAVNQDMAALDSALAAGDEVAFFPPVTGG
ncbi:molybdopterin converting factor subunit 1 [Halieaceae bacterium IMCC14734]|uniref:Molybdopterin synthase sulfur carrier subunit n=1 Tax=Candidatus Litorirhabdus singularis TaxID=2518993 RepID=A0ABT3TGR5_9GAMM|nr:molybdopterin converting factor subunit 1 [Candidatus Litorirhabdus singularis]MCX2981199.1 molybdopterin converting factor subunit 1 [Candidatus Litorirhabdus singularis]